ncbi:aspartyl protease family protein [Gammaproteobacteria bacterium]
MNRRPDPVLLWIACFWLLVLGGGWWFADDWMTSQANPNRQPTITTKGEVVLKRSRDDHYLAGGEINGHSVVFMVDTGATEVALSSALARKLGLPHGEEILLNTANGTATGFKTRLATVHLGTIEMHNVNAVFSQQMMDNVVLLGMSFLKHLEFTQREDRLFLYAPRVE